METSVCMYVGMYVCMCVWGHIPYKQRSKVGGIGTTTSCRTHSAIDPSSSFLKYFY